MPNIYLTKLLLAPSTTGVATISTAATPVITITSSTIDTQRRLSLWSSVALSSTATVTLLGTNESGVAITETVIPSTVAGTLVLTSQDFLTVTSITTTAVPLGPISIGKSSVGSSPWQFTNTCADPFTIGFGVTLSSTTLATTFSVDYTFDDYFTKVYKAPTQPFIPTPFVSTAVSTTGTPTTTGKIDFPITAWRMTLNATSTSALVSLAAIPVGLGS